MTATLDAVASKKKAEPSAEQRAAEELVRQAREPCLSLTGPAGLLKQLIKVVPETALDQELTEHLDVPAVHAGRDVAENHLYRRRQAGALLDRQRYRLEAAG